MNTLDFALASELLPKLTILLENYGLNVYKVKNVSKNLGVTPKLALARLINELNRQGVK